jgi:hypothetical protein
VFCYLKMVLRNIFVCVFFLYIDGTIVMRYVYIFWLKNPAAFNDEFWSRFIFIWIYGV